MPENKYEKTIAQLKDLIHDRESLLSGNAEYDDVFDEDIKALKIAVRVLSKANSRHINSQFHFMFGSFIGTSITALAIAISHLLASLIR